MSESQMDDKIRSSLETEVPCGALQKPLVTSMGKRCVRNVTGLLHFSILAASTIGPGTVVVCSKSGSDYGLKLTWTLILSSFVAFALQEGAARLCIVSQLSMGQAMRMHFNGSDPTKLPIVCTAVAVGIFIGNMAYEANNFVGGSAALYTLGVPNKGVWRALINVVFGTATIVILFFGDVDFTSQALGVCVVFMALLFGIAAFLTGIDWEDFGYGLLPNFPPGDGSISAISMVATTAIPFNCFLASMSAEGYSIKSMREGIGFSTAMAGILSFFVLVAGTGVRNHDKKFTVEDLQDSLQARLGLLASYSFGFGLYAAALSSALTVALGASLTVQSIFSNTSRQPTEGTANLSTTDIAADQQASDCQVASNQSERQGAPNPSNCQVASNQPECQGASNPSNCQVVSSPVSNPLTFDEKLEEGQTTPLSSDDDDVCVREPQKVVSAPRPKDKWASEGYRFRGIIAVLVLVSVLIAATGANTVVVIYTAQVVNGVLLPIIATSLLVCLNDKKVMVAKAPTRTENACLVIAVAMTIYLAFHTFVEYITTTPAANNVTSLVLTALTMIPIMRYMRWQASQPAVQNYNTIVGDGVITSPVGQGGNAL